MNPQVDQARVQDYEDNSSRIDTGYLHSPSVITLYLSNAEQINNWREYYEILNQRPRPEQVSRKISWSVNQYGTRSPSVYSFEYEHGTCDQVRWNAAQNWPRENLPERTMWVDPTNILRNRLRLFPDSELVKYARHVVTEITDAVRNTDTSDFPSFWLSETEDGSFLIEWIFPNRRLLFSIEKNIRDSSWSIVALRGTGFHNDFGLLSDADISNLLERVMIGDS